MNKNPSSIHWIRPGLWLGLCACLLVPLHAGAQDEGANRTFDNLVQVEGSELPIAYIDPDADFSVYERVALAETTVAFRRNWQRDQNRGRSRNISTRDMERIKADVATEFERVFIDRLEDAGYEVVDVVGDDVLLIAPAIIDLDIAAPEVRSPGRTQTFTTSAGAATLLVELFDSVSGDVIARGADRQEAPRDNLRLNWSSRLTNIEEGRRLFNGWADRLIGFLDRKFEAEETP